MKRVAQILMILTLYNFCGAEAPTITLKEYVDLHPTLSESSKERFGRLPIPTKQKMPDLKDKFTRYKLEEKTYLIECRIFIDADGRVSEVKVTKTPDDRLNPEVIRALRRWRFARPEPMKIEDFGGWVTQKLSYKHKNN